MHSSCFGNSLLRRQPSQWTALYSLFETDSAIDQIFNAVLLNAYLAKPGYLSLLLSIAAFQIKGNLIPNTSQLTLHI
jgi:hypothetical protein